MKWIIVCGIGLIMIFACILCGNRSIGLFNEFLEINKLDERRVKQPRFIHVQRDDPTNGMRLGHTSTAVKYDGKVCLQSLIFTIINIILSVLLSLIFIIVFFVFDQVIWWIWVFELGYFCVIGLIAGYYKIKLNKQTKK